MWKLLMISVLGVFLSLSGCGPVSSPAARLDRSPPRFVAGAGGQLQAAELVEASGLAASRRDPDLLWAVNDSGNRPVLYALGTDGSELGRVTLNGVSSGDWEDLAAFAWRGEAWLLVADIGDNPGRRSQAVLHALPEPQADAEGRFPEAVRPAWSLPFTYPDGPRDCEALAVDAAAEQVLLLSKRSKPPILYRLPLQAPVGDRPLVATPVGPLATIPPPSPGDLMLPYGRYLSAPTAMDLSTDGRELLILTYRHAYLLRRSPGQDWKGVLAEPPLTIKLPDLFTLAQREAACFSVDGQSLFVTGEGAGAVLLRLERQ